MNKYPLDLQGIRDISNNFIEHHRAQEKIILDLINYLREAMAYVEDEEDHDWCDQANNLMNDINKRKLDFENFRFDQQNGHYENKESPYDDALKVDLEKAVMQMESAIGTNDQFSEEELAVYFKEPLPKKKKKEKSIGKMTMEEIREWEIKQDNSIEIYKVLARIKNLARGAHASLTPAGEAMCNSFGHVLKSFYDFAESLPDKETKIRLMELTRKQEKMPGDLIEALKNQVK